MHHISRRTSTGNPAMAAPAAGNSSHRAQDVRGMHCGRRWWEPRTAVSFPGYSPERKLRVSHTSIFGTGP